MHADEPVAPNEPRRAAERTRHLAATWRVARWPFIARRWRRRWRRQVRGLKASQWVVVVLESRRWRRWRTRGASTMQLVEQLLLLPRGRRHVLHLAGLVGGLVDSVVRHVVRHWLPRDLKDADRIDSAADGVDSRQALHTVASLKLSPLEVVMQADSDPSAEGVLPRYMRHVRIEREVGVGRP